MKTPDRALIKTLINDKPIGHTDRDAIRTTSVTIGFSDDEYRAICLFANSAREKANTNAQANMVFKFDKRPQFSLLDGWLDYNLGPWDRRSSCVELVLDGLYCNELKTSACYSNAVGSMISMTFGARRSLIWNGSATVRVAIA